MVAAVVFAVVALVRIGEGGGHGPRGFDRLLAYDLRSPVAFALEADEREVRLFTWLATDDSGIVDDRATDVYAIAVTVTDAGGTTALERTVWLPTRRSWLAYDERLRPQHLVSSDRALWDHRSTLIDVDGLVPLGGTLEVRAVHAPRNGSLLVVAHRRAQASTVARMRTLRQGGTDTHGLAPWPFSALPTAWQVNAASTVWDRLGALPPVTGGRHATARLETWFGGVDDGESRTGGAPVWPGGALVWLLDGTTTFTASLSGEDARTEAPGNGSVRIRHADGTETVTRIEGATVGPIFVSGPTEITFALDPAAPGPRWVEARTTGGSADRAQGDPPRTALDDEVQAVVPDFREIAGWRVTPEEPLRFAVEDATHTKVTLRRPLPGSVRPGLAVAAPAAACTAVLAALAADGTVLDSWSLPLVGEASAYERYVRGEDEGDTAVSEPLRVFFRPPDGTAELRVSADTVLDVAVSVTDRPDTRAIPFPDYALPPAFPWTLRYEPQAERGWHTRAPVDEEALAFAGRSVAIDAQVRWAPRHAPGDDDPTAADKSSLPLHGPFELVAEPTVQPAATGGRVRVGAIPTTVLLPVSGRLDLAWRVPLASVGRWVRVEAGGRTLQRRLNAAGGILRVDGLGTGPVPVSVTVEGEGARRTLFLASGQGTPAWQVRRVWSIADEGERVIELPAGRSSVSVDVYRVGEVGHVRWWIEEDGALPVGPSFDPVRRTGAAADPWSDLATTHPLSFDGVPLTRLRPIVVHRPEGSRSARLVLRPEGAAVWVRAQSTWATPDAEHPVHTRREAEL
jgi:hypothetical protein